MPGPDGPVADTAAGHAPSWSGGHACWIWSGGRAMRDGALLSPPAPGVFCGPGPAGPLPCRRRPADAGDAAAGAVRCRHRSSRATTSRCRPRRHRLGGADDPGCRPARTRPRWWRPCGGQPGAGRALPGRVGHRAAGLPGGCRAGGTCWPNWAPPGRTCGPGWRRQRPGPAGRPALPGGRGGRPAGAAAATGPHPGRHVQMGSSRWQVWWLTRRKFPAEDELPRHPVEVPEFSIGQFPVTNAEYACFVAAGGYRQEHHWRTARPAPGCAGSDGRRRSRRVHGYLAGLRANPGLLQQFRQAGWSPRLSQPGSN